MKLHAKGSVFKRILIPILAVMLLQSALLFGTIFLGGTVNQLENNSYDIFREKVSNRKDNLQNEMLQRWSNVQEVAESATKDARQLLAGSGKSIEELVSDPTMSQQLLSSFSSELVYLLRKNTLTGAFLVLNSGGDNLQGVYLRDSNPEANPSDLSDLLALRGPSQVTKELNIALDSLWQPTFTMTPGEVSCDFFYKPFIAAAEHPDVGYTDLGYWSRPFHLNDGNPLDSVEILTYSVPLVYDDGTPYGVLGVELSTDYLKKELPVGELDNDNKAGYLLAYVPKDGLEAGNTTLDCTPVVSNGSFLTLMTGNREDVILSPGTGKEDFYRLQSAGEENVGCVEPLRLYNTHTPFEDNQWVLIGVTDPDVLLNFSHRFQNSLYLALLLSIGIGIVSILIVSKLVTQPIGALAYKLRHADPDLPIVLSPVHIAEVDELADSIQQLSQQVTESSSKLSMILEMVGVSIGAFEYDRHGDGRVTCTPQLFPMLGMPNVRSRSLRAEVFDEYLKEVLQGRLEESDDTEHLYLFRMERNNGPYWIRLNLLESEDQALGVFTDVTHETLEKQKIEHDRDFDLLTNLYNRRAFYSRIQEAFIHPEHLGVCAVIMMDLDNLKFINDTYGHDYGDEYIRSAATALRKNAGPNALISRLSGDEFVLFLSRYTAQDEVRAQCELLQRGLQETALFLPDQTKVRIRASAGISWYPADSDRYEDLIRYADFAMYMVKHSDKGRFTEFSLESYNRDAYLLHCREELNTLLEKSLVDYQFQPILDAHTGEVFAFEALMRPSTENIKNPAELLSLARSRSKLPQVERLTFFRSLECFSALSISRSNCRLFINSISNQCLSDEDLQELEYLYAEYLNRIVVELTEEERPNAEATIKKQQVVAKWGSSLALDDFGVGYNGEISLISLDPAFIKLDMSLVQGVDTDKRREQLLKNLISYSKERNIRVIAEGVETYAEMEALIVLGVDYLQGYYLCKPTYTPELVLPECRREIKMIYTEAQKKALKP